jgi:hypothetical protein
MILYAGFECHAAENSIEMLWHDVTLGFAIRFSEDILGFFSADFYKWHN